MNKRGKKPNAKPLSLDNLPSDLVDAVLVRMPLRDAVRTSVLSRQWRYRWAAMTKLEFRDWDLDPRRARHSEPTNNHFPNIVDRVLMLHVGPIHTFKLSTHVSFPSIPTTPSNVDQWLISLSRNGIRNLELSLPALNYTVHSSVFYCQSIEFVYLLGCTVKLPYFFDGFANLSKLVLQNVTVSEGDLRSLISNCVLLEELNLLRIEGCDCFEISGPNLRYLLFRGQFTDFSLMTSPVLSELSIDLSRRVDVDHARDGGICNSSKILACADSIEKLELLGCSSEFLALGCKPEKLPVVFECLQSLQLGIRFSNMEESALLLSLLRSSPYLRELKLYGRMYHGVEVVDKIWEMSEDMDVFGHLRFLEVLEFRCIKPEMEFVQYVLGHARVLQRMKISIDVESGKPTKQVFIQLLGFQRASREAKIIYIE